MLLRVATRNVLIAEGARDRDVISSSESNDLCKALVPLFGVVSSVPVSMVPESAQEDAAPRIPVGADGSPDRKTVLCQSSKWETSFVATSVQPARISGGCHPASHSTQELGSDGAWCLDPREFMKNLLFAARASVPCAETRAGANPVNKVIELFTDLETKIKGEGLEAHRDHKEFTP